MDRTLQEIRKLAGRALAARPGAPPATISLLSGIERDPKADDAGQVGGLPPIRKRTWPTIAFGDPLVHVLTLYPGAFPEWPFRARAAMCLFADNPTENEGYVPESDAVAVVLPASLVTPDPPRGASGLAQVAVRSETLEVPAAVFDEEPDDEPVCDLREALLGTSFAGGRPIWIQGPEYEGRFLAQFTQDLVPDLNLGDAGVMYVFRKTAFWQCY